MKVLKNGLHTELAISILIQDEESLDAKLSLLTEISLTSTNPDTFAICEKLRERLCGEEGEKVELRDLHHSAPGWIETRSTGHEEFVAMDDLE